MAAERRLKHSRLGRVSQLGRLAGGIAAGVLGEGARQLAKGNRPALSDMLLTPSNARRAEFLPWRGDKRHLVMENFYRWMRRRASCALGVWFI